MQIIPKFGVCNSYFPFGGMQCILKSGMLGVSREIIPFWYEIHTFVLTVHVFCIDPYY